MTLCGILVEIGLTILCPSPSPPPPPPPDLAALQLERMQDEMHRQEKQADQKLDWLYGRSPRARGGAP